MVKISSSILSADLANLEKEIRLLELSGTDMIHIDVMDGHFVPNLTFGPQIIKSIRRYTKLEFDVHLMITNPENYIEDYVSAGADIITIHPEALSVALIDVIQQVKIHKIKFGVAITSGTDLGIIYDLIDKIDICLFMTVQPGFAGQNFIVDNLFRMKQLMQKIKGNIQNIPKIQFSVDGGINNFNAPIAVQHGANILVSASYIFGGNYKERITRLKQSANPVHNDC
ncbi:ribulose-phosphate 3-epimerase [Rickettsia endosymbiont of Cardiosporidium cionae]|uniref:ribulose-phosphate 3-epimerase n=1 Tax=Rickettsia endosymbiont of Cardiosporidium cionae TaxID=2777155 RepID=UPI001895C900|nr:ribulose-phosphate 3-epimerase [Rickettsia endosymbiont of Cardiosporidium cionae]KAF8818452.1 ribulose-phosphate 3-epimerase [Rickettsia endosymbiont of Cardiosporidium cionae]